MKTLNTYAKKKILVLGLAKSGAAAAKILFELGANITVNDMKPFEENREAQELVDLGIKVVCGSHPLELLDSSFDMVVKNPGIPYSNPMVDKALKLDIPIITEVEIAYHLTNAKIIGITGSNGKTTTTTLIYEMLETAGKKPLLAGNIGNVACQVANGASDDQIIVMELSSFQLMGIQDFRPDVAVFLNLFSAHLDYHGTKKAYGQAKANLFKNQTNADSAILNADDQEVMTLARGIHSSLHYFSSQQSLKSGAYIKDNTIFYDQEEIINVENITLKGTHNLENILAAIQTVKLFGVSNKAICTVLTTFTGVKHRLQLVRTILGRGFYNDSKATNSLATIKALEAFEQSTILLAGGLDRGNDFDDLIPSLRNVKAIVAFGESAQKIAHTAKKAGIEMVYFVETVDKAVIQAFDVSTAGDIILLSPACASWDQFRSFEERGDMFVNSVHKLEQSLFE